MGGRGTHAQLAIFDRGLSITLADSTMKTGDHRKIVQVSRMMVRGCSKWWNMPGLVKLCSWTWRHNHEIFLHFYEKHSNICLDWKITRLGSMWSAMTCHVPTIRVLDTLWLTGALYEELCKKRSLHDWAKHEKKQKKSLKSAFLKLHIGSEVKLKMSSCYIVHLLNDDLHVMSSPKEKRSLK